VKLIYYFRGFLISIVLLVLAIALLRVLVVFLFQSWQATDNAWEQCTKICHPHGLDGVNYPDQCICDKTKQIKGINEYTHG
jgi:uncharacterized protein YoxC